MQAVTGGGDDRAVTVEQASAVEPAVCGEPVARRAALVDVQDVRPGQAGGDADVGGRLALPPPPDLPGVGGGVTESVPCSGFLAAGLARGTPATRGWRRPAPGPGFPRAGQSSRELSLDLKPRPVGEATVIVILFKLDESRKATGTPVARSSPRSRPLLGWRPGVLRVSEHGSVWTGR